MTLMELISQVPQGYQWLLRSDESRGFFCNITPDGFIGTIGKPLVEGESFRCYAETAEQALIRSLEKLKEYQHQKMLEQPRALLR